jgi:hypothetical protein
MPGTIIEIHGSRNFTVSINGGEATFLYMIFGEPDEATAYDLVLANSPGTWYQYTRDSIDMSNRPAMGLWYPVVKYKLPQFAPGEPLPSGTAGVDPAPSSPSSTAPADGEPLKGISFSVTTEMQKVYRSLETIASGIVGGGTAPDLHRLVGVSQTGPDGRVEGVDVPTPVATFRKNAVLPDVNHGYFRNLLRCCGKTNAEPFLGFNYEELLFMGCQGHQRGGGDFELEFEFKFQETKTNIYIAPGLTCPEKKGWNYLWTMNRKERDTGSNLTVERPFAWYVERVIDTVGLGWLGI